MRGLVARKLHFSTMSDSRMGHASHRHHPHPSHSYAVHGAGPSHPSHSAHPSYSHHSSRHISNGPPQSVVMGGHGQSMPMSGPGEPIGPPAVAPMGNGHAQGPLGAGSGVSPSARAAKEKMDNVLSQLASANENTWMLIGEMKIHPFPRSVTDGSQARLRSRCKIKIEHWRPSRMLFATTPPPFSVSMPLRQSPGAETTSTRRSSTSSGFSTSSKTTGRCGDLWVSAANDRSIAALMRRLGHCLLMKDDLPKAYTAYQQALYHLPNPKVSERLHLAE